MPRANSGACARLGGRAFAAALCTLHCALLAGCASSPARPARGLRALAALRADIIAATRLPGVSRGVWGVEIYSLDRHERLFDLNSRSLFVPASVAKLVSVASAADAVGWDYRFETTLRTAGHVAEGTLDGDLLAVGSGDPSIGGRGGGDLAPFLAAVRNAGITRIQGRVIGDDDALEEPRPQLAWAWDDLGYTTGALFGALNLGENRASVTVTPGVTEGAATTLALPFPASRPLVNRTVTGPPGSAQLVWPEQRPGEDALTIAGSIPAGAAPLEVAVSVGNPTIWFARVLRNRLIEDGVTVVGDAADIDEVTPPPDRASAQVIFKYESPTLAELAKPLLKESINLYGEALMRLNAEAGVFPTNDAALAGLHARLASWGLVSDSYQLVDGSGLSRRDTVSPEAILLVLERMYDPSGNGPFVAALPVAGVDGSLEGRMKGTPAEGNVRAKTGTMSNVRSLAGYVTSRGGEHLAFVIFVNNFEGTGADAHRAIDAIAVRLAEFTR